MKNIKEIYNLIIENILIEESIKDAAITKFGDSSQDIVNKFWDEIRHKEIDPKKKDINFWLKGNYADFKNYVENFKSNKQEKRDSKKEVNKIFEDDTWLIISPLTKEASIEYGKGTKWCTAAYRENKYFLYNLYGTLYYVINKQNNEKYAFNFNIRSYVNNIDKPIINFNIFPKYILNILLKLAKKEKCFIKFYIDYIKLLKNK